jgi:hypothetical protein
MEAAETLSQFGFGLAAVTREPVPRRPAFFLRYTDGDIPMVMNFEDDDDALDEELRLFYVAALARRILSTWCGRAKPRECATRGPCRSVLSNGHRQSISSAGCFELWATSTVLARFGPP